LIFLNLRLSKDAENHAASVLAGIKPRFALE